MPKSRQTCTRCSQRRQKCDRKSPCSRCVQNNEGHLCTTRWTNGYNPSIHRKYPRKESDGAFLAPDLNSPDPIAPVNLSQRGTQPEQTSGWPGSSFPVQNERNRASRNQTQDGDLRASCPIREHSFSSGGSPLPPSQEAPSTANLDFITFGRSDLSDISIGALLSVKDAESRSKSLMNQNLNQSQVRRLDDAPSNSGGPISLSARAVEMYQLQALLPNKTNAIRMADYQEHNMLYWLGGVYHAPSFRRSVLEAYGQSDTLDLQSQNLDLRWTALFFAILASTIVGAPDSVTTAWGYSNSSKLPVAKQWGSAAISCLLLGDFASKFHIYSIQAILNLHTSQHLVGSSKEFMVYQGAALGIARGLGLHRLGPHPEDNISPDATQEQKDALIQREMGRRVWWAMVNHDWLCSSSTGYYNVQVKHYTTTPPRHFDEESMTLVGEDSPQATHSSHRLHVVARVLIDHHDEMLDAPDILVKYAVVLKYDARMRSLSTEQIAAWLLPQTPVNPAWPSWVTSARRLHQLSLYHKIIMIHQGFMPKSFKSPRFAYSRWACIDAARHIIDEMSRVRGGEEPQWWVEQAFVVTAGLCFALDLFHRSDKEPEVQEYLGWAEKSIRILQTWPTSSIASHGVRLLGSLIYERTKRIEASKPNPPPSPTVEAFPDSLTPLSMVQVPGLSNGESQVPLDAWIPNVTDFDMVGLEEFMETFPLEASLDNNMFLENMLHIANSEFL
ncbi:hypothetical protein BCR34DRAFT_569458 [Clohesyomyces aquaticus]|uniref:Zn(2)-C6 fungal-type domain-containing protein n=1 Tax=Clohesyomyces aquaticus TaxID=1231657 RepID=A0A1Y1ZEP5_9PLEO|nr:hypothetical protein BCR34DRAFT_569458 [Clohesyomyces aquaticus]